MIGGSENGDLRIHKWLTQSGGGSFFGDVLLPPAARLRRLYVHCADLVDGLQLEYEMPDGIRGLTRFAGGVGGRRHTFELPEGEGLCALSGSYGRFVNSLRFHSPSLASREFGVPGGERFFFEIGGELSFRGIFGREGLYLDSLGVVLEAAFEAAAGCWNAIPTIEGSRQLFGRQVGAELLVAAGERKAA